MRGGELKLRRFRLRKRHVVVAAAALFVAAGLGVNTFRTRTIVTPQPTLVAGPCVESMGIPDRYCTPGVVAETSSQVVCNRTTKGIRPAVSYTDNLKIAQIRQYGYADTNPADYEEDHYIPLELGGDPMNPKNLWPEPRNIVNSAARKDKVENFLHKQVCSGAMTLQETQIEISTNWVKVADTNGL